MIDLTSIFNKKGNPPPESTAESAGPESTCFCCGKPFQDGHTVIANEGTADFGNAKAVITLVCCSKKCANRVDKMLSTLVDITARSLHIALHTNGSVQEFGLRMHVLALVARGAAGAPTETPETTNNAI